MPPVVAPVGEFAGQTTVSYVAARKARNCGLSPVCRSAARTRRGAVPPRRRRSAGRVSTAASWVERSGSPGPGPWARSAARTRRGAASPGRRRSAGRTSGSDQAEPAAVLGVAVPFARVRALGGSPGASPLRGSAPTVARQMVCNGADDPPAGPQRLHPGWNGPGRQGQGLGRFTKCKPVASIGADRARTLGRVSRSHPPRRSFTRAPTIRRQDLGQ